MKAFEGYVWVKFCVWNRSRYTRSNKTARSEAFFAEKWVYYKKNQKQKMVYLFILNELIALNRLVRRHFESVQPAQIWGFQVLGGYFCYEPSRHELIRWWKKYTVASYFLPLPNFSGRSIRLDGKLEKKRWKDNCPPSPLYFNLCFKV